MCVNYLSRKDTISVMIFFFYDFLSVKFFAGKKVAVFFNVSAPLRA